MVYRNSPLVLKLGASGARYKGVPRPLTDPTTVSFKYKVPAGTVTTWTVTAGQIVKDSTGNYHADVSITASGQWFYKFIGVGTVQAVREQRFYVQVSEIP